VDFARLRFGDWVMGGGGVAVLAVMFVDWYELAAPGAPGLHGIGDFWFNAWESFTVVDLVLALAAVMAIAAFVLTAAQPTAAVPLALASLTTILSVVALVLVIFGVIDPPNIESGDEFDTARLRGAWLGLVATTVLTAGCLASIRDERLPQPDNPVEPRLVKP
jgi:hypothetical protein